MVRGEDEADFCITSRAGVVEKPALMGGEQLPRSVLDVLGFKVEESDNDFFLTRWFGTGFGWGVNLFVGIPLRGLMNGGLSAPVDVGTAGCYVGNSCFRELFEETGLADFLKEVNHSGFVSIRMNSDTMQVVGVETGVPGWGLYNILEGLPGTIGDFLAEPQACCFSESWTVGLLLSRFPYPLEKETKTAARIYGLSRATEKHFWLGPHEQFRNSTTTRSTVVGVATSWAKRLSEADNRAVGTCRSIMVEQAQYRTDTYAVAGQVWGRLKNAGVVG